MREGDLIEIVIDPIRLVGSIDLVGCDGVRRDAEQAAARLASRSPHPDLAPDPDLPADTRLWAALQQASGGIWRGCVYDVERITQVLEAGLRALGETNQAG